MARVNRSSPRGRRIGGKTILALLAGALFGTLAFSHAAASSGIVISPFRPLGSSFFAWKASQSAIVSKLGPMGEGAEDLPLIEFGQAALRNAPLSARPAWLVGMGFESLGEDEMARRAMERSALITRREPAAQLWLANSALKANDPDTALGHFDIILRTNTEFASQMLPEMAVVLTVREGRNALQQYARASNPWYPGLAQSAAETLPSAGPLADFLLEAKQRPFVGDSRTQAAYATMVRRLAAEKKYSKLMQVYPLLPGADENTLRSLAPRGTAGKPVYAPIDWDLPDTSDRGGTPMTLGKDRQGIEFFAAPGTTGASGTKLLVPGTARRMHFQVTNSAGNPQASAQWVATCVTDRGEGSSRKSANLLDLTTGTQQVFNLPTGCALVRLEMQMSGGTGRDATTVLVEGLKLARAS